MKTWKGIEIDENPRKGRKNKGVLAKYRGQKRHEAEVRAYERTYQISLMRNHSIGDIVWDKATLKQMSTVQIRNIVDALRNA